jgi:hypothetical protein
MGCNSPSCQSHQFVSFSCSCRGLSRPPAISEPPLATHPDCRINATANAAIQCTPPMPACAGSCPHATPLVPSAVETVPGVDAQHKYAALAVSLCLWTLRQISFNLVSLARRRFSCQVSAAMCATTSHCFTPSSCPPIVKFATMPKPFFCALNDSKPTDG